MPTTRILCKKSYEFVTDEPPEKARRVKVSPYLVAAVPDWVLAHPLFKMAQKSGNAEIMGNPEGTTSMAEIEELQKKAESLGIKNYKRFSLDILKQKVSEAETLSVKPSGETTEPPTGTEKT